MKHKLAYGFVALLFFFNLLIGNFGYGQNAENSFSDDFFVTQILNEFEVFKKEPTENNLNQVLIFLESHINSSRISMLKAYQLIDEISNYIKVNVPQHKVDYKLRYIKARVEHLRGNTHFFNQEIKKIRSNLKVNEKWSDLIFINYSLAFNQLYLSKYDNAIQILFENETYLEKLKSTEEKYALRWHYVSNANTLGICFNKKMEYQKALQYFEIALNRSIETDLKAWIGITSGNIGGVLLQTDQWREGIQLLLKDIAISIENGIEESAVNAIISVSQAYLERNELESAQKYIDSCASLFPILYQKNKMSNRILKDYIRINGDIQFKKNNIEQAIKYYKEAIDTLYDLSEKYRKASSFENHNRFKIEDNVIKTNELEKANQQKKYVYQIFGIVGFSLLIIILIMWRYSTKLKLQNEKIILQNEKLELLNQEKSLFLSILSHDLRGPMIRMKGLLSLYNNNLLNQNEFQKNTNQVEKSIQSLLRMLENLLKWAASSTKNELQLNIKPLALKNIVDEVCLQLEPIYTEKKLVVAQKIESDIWVNADEDALGTVIRNLLNNAIKFSIEKGYVAIYVSKPSNANYIRINIRDEGIGMSASQIEIIMSNKKPNSTIEGTKGEKGFGVGLQLCKNFISKMNGQIGVKSTPGRGSTFYIELPAA
jgi:signal transduction histidine kinase/tetratricopeptide (TPR) repeat protein